MKTRSPLGGHVVMNGLGYVLIAACLAVAAINLFGPFQNWRRLNRELEDSHRRLDELSVLYPLYAELAALDSPARWPSLKLPIPAVLSEHEVTAIPERFRKLAEECQVELGAVSPRVETDSATGRRHLGVELRATGPYRQLRELLVGLAQMPVLERIDKLEVRRETLHEQFTIWARLALE